jgi:uncharacterized oxidoreductase
MPRIKAKELEQYVYEVLRSVKCPRDEARIIAFHIVGSNVAGHDSHGVMALPGYIKLCQKGLLTPGAKLELVKDEATFAVIDAHRNFGHLAAHRATEIAMEKARKMTISCVGVRNVGHMGRMGGYPEMMAKAGMAGFICCASGGVIHSVAPYGGRKGRTGTNPIAMAFPSDPPGRIILIDQASTVHAHGKMNVYKRQGIPFPDDWLLDKAGDPTTNPDEFGAFRTFGGHVGYKGYGILFMVEILCSVLVRDGVSRDTSKENPVPPFSNAGFIIAINTDSFVPQETLRREIHDLTKWITSSPPAEGFTEVLYPGQPEERNRAEVLAKGVPLDDETWKEMQNLAGEFNLEDELPKPL